MEMLPDQKGNTRVTEKKSIYDFLSAKKDIGREIQKIAELFENVNIVTIHDFYPDQTTLEKFISHTLFLSWNGRGTYLIPDELKQEMGVSGIRKKIPTELQTTLYLEYVLNMIKLYESKKHLVSSSFSVEMPIYEALLNNISLILSQLNLASIEKTPEIFILTPKDPTISEAVEIVDKPDVKLAILEYNHITNRNNLAGKQKILHVLAKDFEPRRLELEVKKEWKTLASDLGFLFNTLDIRHNNTEGKKAVPAIQNMSEKDLLEWYDTTYRLYLTAVLLYDYSSEEQQTKITALKTAVNPR